MCAGMCWWFRRVPACAGVGSGVSFRKVPESSGVCYRRFRRQVPESSGVRWCRYRRQGSEGSGELRCGLLLCKGQPCDCFEHLLVITLSTWAEPLRKKWRSCSQTWHKDYATAVGDTTKAYFLHRSNKIATLLFVLCYICSGHSKTRRTLQRKASS